MVSQKRYLFFSLDLRLSDTIAASPLVHKQAHNYALSLYMLPVHSSHSNPKQFYSLNSESKEREREKKRSF